MKLKSMILAVLVRTFREFELIVTSFFDSAVHMQLLSRLVSNYPPEIPHPIPLAGLTRLLKGATCGLVAVWRLLLVESIPLGGTR